MRLHREWINDQDKRRLMLTERYFRESVLELIGYVIYDYILKFDGEDSDGTITYDEDYAYFLTSFLLISLLLLWFPIVLVKSKVSH